MRGAVRKRPAELPLVLIAASVLLVASCSDDDAGDARSGASATGADVTGTITVSAAASLADAFTEIGNDFIAATPETEVEFNFDSSSILATQILEGAPADVFASADEANMTRLTDEGLVVGEPSSFAFNELAIVTKPGNPEAIHELADLADAGVVSLCGEDAPCGRYATEILDAAGVMVPESSITRGQNVTATLTAVTEGDATAGLVYSTDAASAGDAVEVVTIRSDQNVIATYPIGVLAGAGAVDTAGAFRDYVLGDEGRAVLEEFGFLPVA